MDSCTAKIIVVGQSTTGKTSLIKRLVDNEYNINEKATLGVDFKIRTFYTCDQKPIKIHLWDTAGQERFAQLVSSYYRGAHAILFVFDLSRKETFDDISKRWMPQAGWQVNLETGCFPQNTLVYLIGNKLDTLSRQVKKEDALNFASQNQMRAYMEVSAATGEAVVENFQTIVDDVFEMLKGNGEILEDDLDEFNMPRRSEQVVGAVVVDQTRRRGNCC